ncbi:hypothetical protein SMD11_6497 [Streptomyces albireticuli]|uniref:Uncharacterized protein n=1 Tax=Streptomyces albireticuli TaxID=1940 RepID=A0A1Z2LCN3_9ACTN|nr:hypothetical protein SMD11_6497 [Streptomyces albireticuli]
MGPKRTSPVFAQDTFVPLTSGSTVTADGSTGTLPSALASPSSAPRVAGAVLTSVPLSVLPSTWVTLARTPSGAPGVGALAMMSPTATEEFRPAPGEGAEGAAEPAGADGDGWAREGFRAPFAAPEMTARPLFRSYEATFSEDFSACRPPPEGWATALGAPDPSGIAALTASCRSAAGGGVVAAGSVPPPEAVVAGPGAEHPATRRDAAVRAGKAMVLLGMRTLDPREREVGAGRGGWSAPSVRVCTASDG